MAAPPQALGSCAHMLTEERFTRVAFSIAVYEMLRGRDRGVKAMAPSQRFTVVVYETCSAMCAVRMPCAQYTL